MGLLFARLLDITLLKRGPESLPASWTLALALSVLFVLVQWPLAADLLDGAVLPVLAGLLDAALFAVLACCLAALVGRPGRAAPAMSALVGSATILTLVGMPLAILFPIQGQASPQPVLLVAYIALLVWQLAVIGHIVQRTTERPMAQVALVTFTFYFADLVLFSLLIPPVAGGAGGG